MPGLAGRGWIGAVFVRAALPSELPAIGDLRVTAYQADGFALGSYAATLRALGFDGAGEVLAAEEDGAIVGTVMLQPWPHADEVVRQPGEAEIRALAVAPPSRGRGIGRALLTAVTERAALLGIRRLLLLTRPDMAVAQRMYVAAGFRRLPELDWPPDPGPVLLAYGKELAQDIC